MKKLLLLSLLVLFGCSKEEPEEEVSIPIGRVQLVFSYKIYANGTFSGGSSSPWLFNPYFSDRSQYETYAEPWGTLDAVGEERVIALRGIDCFSEWNIKVPEPEGYTFAGLVQGAAPDGGWRVDPGTESAPKGTFPNFTKYISCQGLLNSADIYKENTSYLPRITITILWYPNSVF